MRYLNIADDKKNGVVYTPSEMATYLAREIVKNSGEHLQSPIRILDPAVGQGELLIALIRQLDETYAGCQIEAIGYETDPLVCAETEERISGIAPECSVEIINQDFISAVSDGDIAPFDFVIANPPYIRTQVMGSDCAQFLARSLELSGRIDAYYAFLLLTKKVLKPTGTAEFPVHPLE